MKFEKLTARQIAEVDRDNTLVVIPIAAVEQHGPHMPAGTDKILCTSVAEALEAALPSEILLTPTFWLGASAHHLRLGATLDCSLETYVTSLCEIGVSLLEDNFRRLLFLNGHGGNIDPMRVAVRTLQPQFSDCLLAAGSYWDMIDLPEAGILKGDHQFVGHACEFETSLMLHLCPELVDREKVKDAGELVPDKVGRVYVSRDMAQRTREGFTGRPDLATAETGKALFDAISARLKVTAAELLREPLGTEYEELVPET